MCLNPLPIRTRANEVTPCISIKNQTLSYYTSHTRFAIYWQASRYSLGRFKAHTNLSSEDKQGVHAKLLRNPSSACRWARQVQKVTPRGGHCLALLLGLSLSLLNRNLTPHPAREHRTASLSGRTHVIKMLPTRAFMPSDIAREAHSKPTVTARGYIPSFTFTATFSRKVDSISLPKKK
jgi:hypothetical protein